MTNKVFNPFIIRNKVYTDISDYINNVKIKVCVPYHVLAIPKPILDGDIPVPSWYQEVHPNEMRQTYMTTAQCIDLCDKRIKFKIPEKRDLLMSYLYTKAYLQEIDKIGKDRLTNEYKSYYEKIRKYNTCLKEIIEKLCRLDSGFKEWVKGSETDLSNLLSKYSY